MGKRIWSELKAHVPFTAFGVATGVLLMLFAWRLPEDISYRIFYTLHPAHVVLSALATASMYRLHQCRQVDRECLRGRCNFWTLICIGYVGSVGIATLSDSLIPYLGEVLLQLPNRGIHIGFIEKWWLVNPLAVVGVAIAYYRPATKVPHTGHVLLSTWASLFHILMAVEARLSGLMLCVISVFLFLSVWVPCCVSDIVFPLLFVKEKED